MASNALSQDEENYVRMALLLTGISPRAVRVLFDNEFPPASFSSLINTTTTKATLNNLKKRKVIYQAQWDLLFPTSGTTDSKTFDVTLMIVLLRNLPTLPLVPPLNGYDELPVTIDTTPASDLARIKYYRNVLAHLEDGKVDGTLFTTAWKDLSDAVLRLGGNTMKQECDQLMTKQLDKSSQEIVQAMQDIGTIKTSIDLLQVKQTNLDKDISGLKSDQIRLKRGRKRASNDLNTLKLDQIKRKTDVNKLQLDQYSLEKSYGLLQVDQREMRIDVKNVKSDCDMLKTSQALLQSDEIKTKKRVEELIFIMKDPVTPNRRVLISNLLDKWQKNDENFVETRAAKCVLKGIKDNSCLTITASSGVGKTSTLRHVALNMKEEGYDILPVTNPNEIVQFYNPNKKTLFVIDDFCGTYSINQSDLNNWEPVMKEIKMIIENRLTKIVVACRLQVYQDEKFESLSIFRTSVCNLQSEDLCLLQKEKMSIAELYLKTKASEIVQYFDNYDCFPLLCKLYYENPELNIIDFFENPFSVYETEIDKLYKEGHKTKYCALALCVMFNNNLEEKLFSETIDKEDKRKIKNTCEACRLDRGTARTVLLDELNSLEQTFIKKEQGVFKTKHGKLFDFLAYYFGQKMIPCLIKNANPVVIKQRFILEKKDEMDQFITIIPPKYHEMYLQRMIDDWKLGRVCYVFNNINLKTQEFRHKFLCYLKSLKIPFQRQLALTFDEEINDSALINCCYYGDIPLVVWCMSHGDADDVNQCNYQGVSPLFGAAGYGHLETVKLLLDNKADIDKCADVGISPLYIACQNNQTEVVRLLLDKKADINKCANNGASPLLIACHNNHIETVKVLLKYKAKINKCADDGASPLYVACKNNHIEIVKLLLGNKADIYKCANNGESPLFIACQNNHIETVKILLDDKADINKCRDGGVSPLYVACQMNHIEIVKVLLDNKADINKCKDNRVSPLYVACHNNHINIVKLLLDHKADINNCKAVKTSPLLIACHKNHIEIVKVLLDNKAEVDKCNDKKVSPLYVACLNNHMEMVKVLLDNKAKIDRCDVQGLSPLGVACRQNHIELVKVLLDNKADINLCKNNGVSPLLIACDSNHIEIVKVLLENKANIKKYANDGGSPLYIACQNNHTEIVKVLLENKADINKCKDDGVSPLFIACYNNHIEIVKVLLENKADINKCKNDGESPLFVACKNNRIKMIKVLLDNEADVNKCMVNGASPLHIACLTNHIETVRVLLDNGADIHKRMNNGTSPLRIAYQNNHKDITRMLLEKGSD